MFYFIMALLIISFILTYLRQKRYQDNRDMQLKLRMHVFLCVCVCMCVCFSVCIYVCVCVCVCRGSK